MTSEEAYEQGWNDYKNCGGLVDDPISDIFHPNYDPPSGFENIYKKGWRDAKNDNWDPPFEDEEGDGEDEG